MNPLQAAGVNPDIASGWAQAAILLTTVAGFLFQAYRENRNHQWEEQRRKKDVEYAKEIESEIQRRAAEIKEEVERSALEVQREVERRALEVKAEVEARAMQLKADGQAHTSQVHAAIRENMEVNQHALSEANTFNKKLRTLLDQLDTVKTDAASVVAALTSKKVDHIQDVVEDNNTQIRTTRTEIDKLNVETHQ